MKQVRNLMTPQELVEKSIHEFLFQRHIKTKKGLMIFVILVLILFISYVFTEYVGILFLFIPIIIYFIFFIIGELRVYLPKEELALCEPPFFIVQKKKNRFVLIKFSVQSKKYHVLDYDKEVIKHFKEGYDLLRNFDSEGNIDWR